MNEVVEKPWLELGELLEQDRPADIEKFLRELDPGDLIYTVFRLDEAQQQTLLKKISTGSAVDLIEDLPEAQAAEILDEMPVTEAAQIITGLSSDDQADVLSEMHKDDAAAILNAMDVQQAADTRLLMQYEPDVAGGLMQTEYISYPHEYSVGDVLADMKGRQEEYARFRAPFVYVTSAGGILEGVVRVRDLLFADRQATLANIVRKALFVQPNAGLDDLDDFFDDHEINVVPVVEPHTGAIIGVVTRRSVNEELTERSESERLRQAGIVGGEEFRSMPVSVRSRRRFSWLSINIMLNVLAASIIAMYQDTLSAVIALAVFLPIVSDMSGCSGNQAVAVSLRELALGVVKPADLFRVWRQEAAVGLINGAALGTLIALVAYLWQGSPWLGLVVGGALAMNTVIAVSIGGTVPLILRAVKVDPAVASGPILTTVTDMCGFALVLGLATLALPLIS